MRHRELKSSNLGWSWTLKLRAEPLPSDPSPYHAAMNENDFGPVSAFSQSVGSWFSPGQQREHPLPEEVGAQVHRAPLS